jgi:hypothetical protein
MLTYVYNQDKILTNMDDYTIKEKLIPVQPDMLETREEKGDNWKSVRARINEIIDENGDPVDEDIREVVAAFNVNGLTTTGSCEGHVKPGSESNGPWIDVQTPESEEGLKLLESKALTADDRRGIKDELEPNYQKYLVSMINALSAFYQTRHVPYDQQLSIQGSRPFSFRLQNNGFDLLNNKSIEEQKEKLKVYQEELHTFGEFLKDNYFNS